MPKFSYRRARAKGAGGDPVHIRNGQAFQTSAQITEYLLCADCEQRIGDVETSVSRLLPLNDGDPAPLLDLVGLVTDTSSSGYRQVPLGRIGDGDLGFFALSVFWRASVSSQYTMSLDPVDAEAFRRYLLGERGFPENAAVVAIFYDLPFKREMDMSSTCLGPQAATEADDTRGYRLVVNGLHLHLEIGANVGEVFTASCVMRTGTMFLAPQEELVELLAEPVLNARVVDRLRKRFDRKR